MPRSDEEKIALVKGLFERGIEAIYKLHEAADDSLFEKEEKPIKCPICKSVWLVLNNNWCTNCGHRIIKPKESE